MEAYRLRSSVVIGSIVFCNFFRWKRHAPAYKHRHDSCVFCAAQIHDCIAYHYCFLSFFTKLFKRYVYRLRIGFVLCTVICCYNYVKISFQAEFFYSLHRCMLQPRGDERKCIILHFLMIPAFPALPRTALCRLRNYLSGSFCKYLYILYCVAFRCEKFLHRQFQRLAEMLEHKISVCIMAAEHVKCIVPRFNIISFVSIIVPSKSNMIVFTFFIQFLSYIIF